MWNGQTMERTELIPQTSENLGVGNLLYHFSMKRDSTNPPEVRSLHLQASRAMVLIMYTVHR